MELEDAQVLKIAHFFTATKLEWTRLLIKVAGWPPNKPLINLQGLTHVLG